MSAEENAKTARHDGVLMKRGCCIYFTLSLYAPQGKRAV